MGLIHLLSDSLVVAFLQRVAYGKHAVYLTEYEVGTLIVLGADLCLYGLEVVPVGVA